MESFLNIKYQQTTSENFEEYMKVNGLNPEMVKVALTVNPVYTLTCENGVYTLTMSTSFRTSAIVFRLNEEFEEERTDGDKVKSVFTVEGNKLIQVQVEPSGKKAKHVREYSADKLVVKSTSDGWDKVCTRVFEKIN